MKKLLAIFLTALMLLGCLTAFAGCGDSKKEAAQAALDVAAEYLENLYKNDAEKTPRDYDVAGKVKIGDLEYTVTWEVNVEAVTIKESATAGFYTVDVPDETAEEIPYVLTATIKDADGNTTQVSFNHIVPVLQPTKVEEDKKIVLSVKDGEVTKYVTGKHYLYTSSSSGNQKWELEVTETKAEALAMTMKKNSDDTVSFVAEGKYLFCDANNVQFVDEESDNTKFVLETATGGSFIKCAVANYGGKAQYLEFYSGYITCYGMNDTKPEIYTFVVEDAGDAAGKIDIPADTTPSTPETPDTPAEPITELVAVTAPEAETAYKLFVKQVKVGKNLYAIADVDNGKFIKTTETAADALDFYVEIVEGGVKLYTTIDGAKKYVHAYTETNDGKTSKFLCYADSTDAVWTYKAEVNAWFVTIDGAEYVLGTYGTYATFSISESSYITAENTGVSQFPGHLVTKDNAENLAPETPETPEDPETPDLPTTVTPITTIAAMTEASGETKYLVQGVITEVYNTTYGNMYIRDAAGNTLTIYGSYDAEGNRYDAMTTKPQAGDFVQIVGIVTVYQGKGQIKDGTVVSAVTPSTVTGIAGMTEASTDMHLVKGEITEIYNTTYGNMYIKDAEGNTVCIYGTFDEAGNRFDAMTAKPAVGDTIAVIGEVSVYQGKGQIKNGTIVVWDAAPAGGDPVVPEEPAGEKFAIAASAGTLGDKTITWESTNYTMTGAQAESTSAIRTQDTDHFRIYKSSTFNVTAKNSKKIAKATFVVTGESYASVLAASLTTAGVTAVAEGTNVVLTVTDAAGVDALAFTATAQFRVATIYVEFVA